MSGVTLEHFIANISDGYRQGMEAAERSMQWNALGIRQEGREVETGKLKKLYLTLQDVHLQSPFADPETLDRIAVLAAADVYRATNAPPDNDDLICHIGLSAKALLEQEVFFGFPDIDWRVPLSLEDGIALRNYLERKRHFLLYAQDILEIWTDRFIDMWVALFKHLPDAIFETECDKTSSLALFMPIAERMDNPAEAVEHLLINFTHEDIAKHNLFEMALKHIDRNLCAASGIPPEESGSSKRDTIFPSKCREPVHTIPGLYLSGTPFLDIFTHELRIDIPDTARFEHHWIVAGSGHGKTQSLQYLIAQDLEKVARGDASIVVIDSQADMIRNIMSLKMFAPGEVLDGKLVLIDPTDTEYPTALNLFDIGSARLDKHNPADRERLYRNALDTCSFVINAILGADMTANQTTLFNFMTALLFVIPGATLTTFRDLLEPGGLDAYRHHLTKLDPLTRQFFTTRFDEDRQLQRTKNEVASRLWAILGQPVFANMFSAPSSKLDLFQEINDGKVILVHADKSLLGETGVTILGRFFIGLIAQAAAQRATIESQNRLPTFVYIDECHEYMVANDNKLPTILEQARKQSIGLILAHQYLGQLPSDRLPGALAANTSIKMAGAISQEDAPILAKNMHCTVDYITRQPDKGSFTTFIRNTTKTALPIQFPNKYLEGLDRMSDAEQEAVKATNREHYCLPLADIQKIQETHMSATSPNVFEEPEHFSDPYGPQQPPAPDAPNS